MGLRRRVTAILAGWTLAVLFAGVAAAGPIRSSTDSQGKICITNVPPRPAAAPVTPEPAAQGSTPEPAAAALATAPAPPALPAASETPIPAPVIKPVSLESPPAPAADRLAASKAAESGGILRYRDGQGVIHIESAGVERPKSPASPPPGAEPAPSGPSSLQAAAPEPESPLPLKRVAFSPDESSPAAPRTSKNSNLTETAGTIRRYHDSRGVLHINNVGDGSESAPERGLQAGDEPQSRPGPSRKIPPLLDAQAAGPPALKPVSWSGESPLAASGRESGAGPSLASDLPAQGSIRRYRDKQGVWHIESAEPSPLPEERPPPSLLASRSPEAGLMSQAHAALPPAAALAEAGLPPPAGGSKVVASRDRQGRLSIHNLSPEQAMARAAASQAKEWLAPIIAEAAALTELPVDLVQAVIKVESNFVPWAVSPKGAMGLMQLMPGTAAFLGVSDPFSPWENVLAGCRYLRMLLNSFNNSVPLALAAYNAGYQRVIDAGCQIPTIKETQDFVTMVLGHYLSAARQGALPRT